MTTTVLRTIPRTFIRHNRSPMEGSAANYGQRKQQSHMMIVLRTTVRDNGGPMWTAPRTILEDNNVV